MFLFFYGKLLFPWGRGPGGRGISPESTIFTGAGLKFSIFRMLPALSKFLVVSFLQRNFQGLKTKVCFWSFKQARDTIKLSGSYLKGNFSKEYFGDTLLSLSLFTFSFTSILLLLEILLSLYYVIIAIHEYIAVFYFYFWLYYGCFDFDSLLWLFYWQFFLNHELMKQRYNFPQWMFNWTYLVNMVQITSKIISRKQCIRAILNILDQN